jgi:hypothetical protein
MSDINYWFDEYNKENDDLFELVEKLKSLIASSNEKAIDYCLKECELKVNRANEVKKSFGMELRLVKDKSLKNEMNMNGQDLEKKLNISQKFVTQFKLQRSKNSLLNVSQVNENPYSTEGKSNDELLSGASKIQDLAFESLGRTSNMIEASKEIGYRTIEELRSQQDQIKDIEADVDALGSTLFRAEKLVVNFTRRMATDKIIQGFALINIIVMLSLIIYVVSTGKSLSPPNNSGNGGAISVPTFKPTSLPTSNIYTNIPTIPSSLQPK